MSSIEDEELRRRKLEEALEVKSLRRIISAYLKYISVLSRTHQSALYIILCLRLSLCMIVFIYLLVGNVFPLVAKCECSLFYFVFATKSYILDFRISKKNWASTVLSEYEH